MPPKPQSSQINNDTHVPAFDGLRAVAVLAVMLTHFSPSVLIRGEIGLQGVRLFFVLSGYLITALLLRARNRIESGRVKAGAEVVNFFARRALRLWPVYFGVLAVTCSLNIGSARETAWWHISFATNFFIAYFDSWPDMFSHFWSLAVEHQFYLLWPFAMLLLPTRQLVGVAIGLIALAPAWRMLAPVFGWWSPLGARVLLPGCIDSLGCGAMIALTSAGLWRTPHRLVTWRPAFLGLGTAWLLAGCVIEFRLLDQIVFRTLAPLIEALTFATIVAGLLDGRHRPLAYVLCARPLLAMGAISYSVYVVHNFMPWVSQGLLRRLIGASNWESESLQTSWLITLSIVLGFASWLVLERPVLGLRRRLRATTSSDALPKSGLPATQPSPHRYD